MRIKLLLGVSVLAIAALAPVGSASAAAEKCVTVYDFPDAGEKVCVFTEGSCLVGEYRTTFLGTDFNCIVTRPGRATGSRTAQVDPLPDCVKTVIQNVPPFAIATVQRFVESGELPRIMGPFLPC
jgi:hypothetical protein